MYYLRLVMSTSKYVSSLIVLYVGVQQEQFAEDAIISPDFLFGIFVKYQMTVVSCSYV